jgi:hypothetical protein
MNLDRPLTIGEIFDRAVTVVVRHWRPLAALSAAVALVIAAADFTRDAAPNVATERALTLLASVAVWFFYPAIIAICAGSGQAVDLASALLLCLRRLGALVALNVITLLSLLPFAACLFLLYIFSNYGAWQLVVALCVGIAIGLTGLSLYMGYTCLAEVYLVLESRSSVDALRVTAHRCRASGVLRLGTIGAGLTALWLAPSLVVSLLPVPDPLALAVRHALYGLAHAAMGVYVLAVSTVAALDYRNRRLGDDLARALKEAAPA